MCVGANADSVYYMRVVFLYIVIIAFCLTNLSLSAQDSTAEMLQDILLKGLKKEEGFNKATPVQILDKKTLNYLNAPTVGDAVRFFSGVQVKDYGGAGGLKTVSVRSLGASHTGILYDGVPVADVQAGQTDLSRYSSGVLKSLSLHQANPTGEILPATAFASAAILAMKTVSFDPRAINRNNWQVGIKNGSFGYWQSSANAGFVLPRQNFLQFFVNAVNSQENYPFKQVNGDFVETKRRNNSAIRSFQGELNYAKLFKDSATLQVKGGAFLSKRGLPGAIDYYNDRSVQQLYNRDYFGQIRYKKSINQVTELLMLAKANHAYTRYIDPDFLNNAGGRDEHYRQQQLYLSAAVNRTIAQYWLVAFATDGVYARLKANRPNFADPTRRSLLSNLFLSYKDSLWHINGGVLWSYFADNNRLNTAAPQQNKFTPTISVARKLNSYGPLAMRFFYKKVFRMPTLDDLYYNFIGNNQLRPELASQYNLGVVYSKKTAGLVQQFNISLDGYINSISDKIVAVPTQNLFSWRMLNLGKVDIKGIDITTEGDGSIANIIKWKGRIAYTFQQARDITDPSIPYYKERIPYTPDHSGSAMMIFNWHQWQAGYSSVFSGARYRLGGNNYYNYLEGWLTQDVSVSREIVINSIAGIIKLEVNNVGNRQYNVINNYPMPGRSYKLSIHIKY